MTIVRTAVFSSAVSLLLNHRLQAAVAFALALVAGAVLGGDIAEAGPRLPKPHGQGIW